MDIDLVYLWVDGTDSEWRKQKDYWLLQDGNECAVRASESGKGRYFDNGELRYSLRSVEMFAPWIRRIYIVTADQTPRWLDTSHPKVRMVSHRDIMPSDSLPCFNSAAIEYCVQNIPDLSEHYLLSNDDMFFCRDVGPDFFFASDGYPFVRFRPQYSKRHLSQSSYYRRLLNAQSLIRDTFGRSYLFAPHHNMDAYCKSDVLRCVERFRSDVDTVVYSRLRSETGPLLLSLFALACGHAHVKHVGRFDERRIPFLVKLRDAFSGRYHSDSRVLSVSSADYDAMFRKYDPALFCMNDDDTVSDDSRVRAHCFFESKFPVVSSFEKKQSGC